MAQIDEVKRLEATVFGHVQGVFFRDSTRREARARGIGGWVRNEANGTVRVVAEGSEAALREFKSFLHRGPAGASVLRVESQWHAAEGEFDAFNVRY